MWSTGKDLAGANIENCENSQLTPTNLSHLSLVILYRPALKYSSNYVCSDVYLPSYPSSGKEMEVASTVQPYEGEPCASCALEFHCSREIPRNKPKANFSAVSRGMTIFHREVI